MANAYDAAARLAEGRPIVDDVEEYVAACRQLGYQHRDLTMHSTQVRDWYGGEEGMDLHALDADHVTLSAAASAAEDAVRLQTDLVAALSEAWSGRGAGAAHEFVSHSCQAATAVSAALRRAADAVATLRDALWRAVDGKVSATEAVDARQQPQRAEWLAAAKTVTTGAGDLAAASELVELKVKPFVDLAVGSEWLPAMRAAVASAHAGFESAIASAATAPVVFGVPGQLGPPPVWSGEREAPRGGQAIAPPSVPTSPTATVAPAPVAPASVAPPPVAPWSGPPPLAEVAPGPPAPPAMPSAPPSAMPSMPALPSTGDLGAGSSTLGSGLSGFGQQLADLIGGLLGSAGNGATDSVDVAEPDTQNVEPDVPSDEEPGGEPDDPAADEDADAADDPTEPAGEVVGEPVPEPPAPTPAPPPPEPTPAPPPPEPPPAPQALPEAVEAGEPTPCEIAADELPQVGE